MDSEELPGHKIEDYRPISIADRKKIVGIGDGFYFVYLIYGTEVWKLV